MLRGIDHLVIACADPDAAADELESALGIACAGGGRHEGAGTRNRIAWLGDGSYLELIGVDDAELARRTPVGAAALSTLDAHGGGLATYALRVDDVEQVVASLPEGAFGPVVQGSRTRADGDAVEWSVAFPSSALAPDGVPFLIQHVYVGAEWGHEALAGRAAFRHPIGSPVLLTRLDLATPEPAAAAAELHATIGIDVRAVADLAVAEVGSHVIRFVPRREMAVPAVITLGADVDAPRVVELLGLRFDIARVEMPVPAEVPG